MGAFISWLLTGGATAAISAVTKIGEPLAHAYDTKQKAAVDTHKIDTDANTQTVLAQNSAEVQVAQLDSTIALEDSKHVATSWMRPTAFAMSLFVFALVIIGAKLPNLARMLSISNNDLPGYWSWLPLAIISAVVVLRPWEKNKSAQNTAVMQKTIAQSLARQ